MTWPGQNSRLAVPVDLGRDGGARITRSGG
jgi:hypothetical protein